MGWARTMFIRGGALLSATLLVGAAFAPAAHAATGRAVTGPVVGSAPFDFEGCSFVHQTYEGDIATPSGQSAALDVDVCVAIKGDHCTVKGTFVIKAGSGKVRGGASGTVECLTAGPKTAFDFTLHVHRSSPGLADPGQALHFRGIWRSDTVSGGPFKGKVTLR
jgi:hypothetical protein